MRPRLSKRTIFVIAAAISLAFASCKSAKPETEGGENEPSAKKPAATADAGATEKSAPGDTLPALTPWRSLYDEAGRARQLRAGLVIDAGTIDLHKYTRGGWGTGWRPNDVTQEGTTYARWRGETATLLDIGTPWREVVVRARGGCEGSKLVVSAGDAKASSSADISADWGVIRVAAPGGESVASSVVTLAATNACKTADGGGGIDVDWVYFAEAAGAEEVPVTALSRRDSVDLGGEVRRALVAADGGSFRFAVDLPEAAQFSADLGATAPGTFALTVHDGDQSKEIDRREVAANAWESVRLDLAEYAGKAVEIELTAVLTEPGTCAWGEPEIGFIGEPTPSQVGFGTPPAGAILITVDSGVDLAPLAARGTHFSRAYSAAPGADGARLALRTGAYPWLRGTGASNDAEDVFAARLISDLLAENGAKTGAIESADLATATAEMTTWLAATGGEPFFLSVQVSGTRDLNQLSAWLDQNEEPALIAVAAMPSASESDPLAAHLAPLTLIAPGILPEGVVVEAPVELIDVAPTMLELTGGEPSRSHHGASLVAALDGELSPSSAYALLAPTPDERVVVTGTFAAMASVAALGPIDVKGASGPETGASGVRVASELLGLGLSNPTKHRRLEDVRHDLSFQSAEIDVDPELARQLEALGYFGD